MLPQILFAKLLSLKIDRNTEDGNATHFPSTLFYYDTEDDIVTDDETWVSYINVKPKNHY